jgi:transcriptional regulator with XRE-family HTH domain
MLSSAQILLGDIFVMKQKAKYKAMRQALVYLRKRAGISQVVLAERLKTEQSHISRIEKGVRRVDFVELLMYLQSLDSNIDEMMELMANPKTFTR